jgi:DNA-binding transcriptional LysR family regulator
VDRVDDPTVQQLRSLLKLAEELHFGRAAGKLYLTQPALSQQIRSIENRLGVQLFTRTSRRVQVTPMGHALLPLVRNVVEATDDLHNAARRSAIDSDGLRLRIGLSDCSAALASTRRVLGTFTTLHPHVEVDLQVVDLIEQAIALAAGRIDAAFVYLPVEGFHSVPLTTEPRVVCISSADPLAQRSSLWLSDLAGHPVVSLTPEMSPGDRDFWAMDPRPDGSRVRYTDRHVARVEALLSTVSFDGAIAFLPANAAKLYPRPDVQYLPVHDLVPCKFGVVWPSSGHKAPHIAALEDICRRLGEEGLPNGTMESPRPMASSVESLP